MGPGDSTIDVWGDDSPDVLRPVVEEGEEGGEVRERDGRAGRFLDDRGDGVATTPAPSS